MMMKNFRIGDIFIQERGKEKSPNQVPDGEIPMINETSDRNGFTKLCTPSKVFAGNCLTVSINFATTVFYQPMDFAASVNIAILRNDRFTEKSYLYVATVLRQAHLVYDYNHKISKDKLNNEIIPLPVRKKLVPDFNLLNTIICSDGGIDMSQIDTSTWREFKLEDLFDITTTKSLNKNAITFRDDGPYDFIGRSSVNYGIQGHLEKQGFDPNPANVFSLVQVGESVCLFREKEWYASQNIFMLNPKDQQICAVHSFFETLINKHLSIYQSAYEYPCLNDIKDMCISLPCKETEEIDFDYMESYISELEAERISELEAERISELEAFLAVTGLDDYELTEEDIEILNRYQTEEEVAV